MTSRRIVLLTCVSGLVCIAVACGPVDDVPKPNGAHVNQTQIMLEKCKRVGSGKPWVECFNANWRVSE
jgi:hypothetical protein